MPFLETVKEKIFNISSQEIDEIQKVKEINEIANNLRDQRLNWEKRWLIVDRFIAGNHFDVWKPASNEIGQVTFPKGMNVRPIHYAVRTTEGTLNNIISADPQWKVFPHGLAMIKNEEERKKRIEYARKIGLYFDTLWDKQGLRNKVAEMVWNGLKYGFGVLEVYWENGPKIRVIDSFDILFDPLVKDIRNSSVVIKEVVVDVKEAQKVYGVELKEDNKLSGSSFKETRLIEKHSQKSTKNKVFIREAWVKNPSGGWDVIHTAQNKILFFGHYNFVRHPFVSWAVNFEPLLQTSWFERLMPLNKAIDIIMAQIEMWVRAVAVGRLLKKKGVDIERVMGEHGEIIDVEGIMDSVQWLQPAEIGVTPFNYLAELKSLISEIGASTTSIGRAPKGMRTGWRLVESLKASEMSSIQHAVRSLEETIEALAENVLMFINQFGEIPIEFMSKNEIIELIGKNWANLFSESVPVSDTDFGIDVSIESGLAYTSEARRELTLEMAAKNLIPIQTALELLGVGGDTEEIAQRALAELKEKTAKKQEKLTSVLDADDWEKIPDELKIQILEVLKGQLEE